MASEWAGRPDEPQKIFRRPSGDYRCHGCQAVFVVDPDDPIEAESAYLEHLTTHDAEAGSW